MKMHPTDTVSIALPDEGADTNTFTQYGMRYPNGHTRWVNDHPVGSVPVIFELLHERHPEALDVWNGRLKQRAGEANISLSEYREGHELVKRTVIVAVTDAEEL